MKNRFFSMLLLSVLGATPASARLQAPGAVQTLPHLIVVGWDGVQRDHFWACYDRLLPECAAGLPNLKRLVRGRIFDSTVTDGATQTKPGWPQMLSGYRADVMGIYSNGQYQPLSEGYSIFEKIESTYGDGAINTVFVAGKGINVGATCPGELTIAGEVETRGHPWCLTKRQIDTFIEAEEDGLENNVVGARSLQRITDHFVNHPGEALVAFFHFAEPDTTGHLYGENSTEYTQQLVDLDVWLGRIVARVKAYGGFENTRFYITTDHGFDEASHSHQSAPYGFLATNDPLVVRSGDRMDLGPTLLELYGVTGGPLEQVPPVDGHSLYTLPPIPCIPENNGYVDYPGAPACCEGLALISMDKYDAGKTARDRCIPATGGTGDGSGYCSQCGDGACGPLESVCNCPQDCSGGYAPLGAGPEALERGSGSTPAARAVPDEIECPLRTVKTTVVQQDFEAWPPAGWSIVDNGGDCSFDSSAALGRPNNTGGEGECADADSDRCGPGTTMDTELRSPLLDLSGFSDIHLQYNAYYLNFLGEDAATLDISTDGGASWGNLLTWGEDHIQPARIEVDLTPYAGSAETVLRWRYTAPGWNWLWEADAVEVAACEPAPPGVYLTPESQAGAACQGGTVDYTLSLWNNTGQAGTFSLSYGANWPVHGPAEVYAEYRQVVDLDLSVDVLCGDADTALVTAQGNGFTDTAELQTTRSESWATLPPLPTPRGDLAVVASGGGLYAIGGTRDGALPGGEVERYDLAAGTWSAQAAMPVPLTLVDGAEIDGIIYIPGGYTGSAFTASVLAYDTASGAWSEVSPAPRAVAGYGLVACQGKLWRVGGAYYGSWPLGELDAEVYDPVADAWTPLPAMTWGHTWPAVACLNGKLYVAGGIGDDVQRTEVSETYDIAAGTWDDPAMADLPEAWWGAADFVKDGKPFLAGGFFSGRASEATITYDPATDAWTEGPPLGVARFRHEGDSALGTGYVLGGWEPTWSPKAANETLMLCPTCMHIQRITLKSKAQGGQYIVTGMVQVRDASGGPVPGVSVTVRWTLPDGRQKPQVGITDSLGWARFRIRSAQTGPYELCVTGAAKAGYFYNPSQNLETCDAMVVP